MTGTTTTAYTDAGRVRSVTTPDPDGDGPLKPQTTTYEYDSRGRRVKITKPDGAVVHRSYYPTGELKRKWGSRTYPVAYSYDAQGRKRTMTTWQDFDADTGRAVTTWNYDPQRGFLTSKVYDDGNGTSYTYTPGGKLKTRTWARGVVTTYSYTNAGDLASVSYSDDTPDVSYTYNRAGQRSTVTDAAGTHTFTYTDAGQRSSETVEGGVLDGLSMDYAYDDLNRRTALAYEFGSASGKTAYTYDAASRLQSVTSGDNVYTYTYQSGSNQVKSVTFNNGTSDVMTRTREYDNLNRVISVRSEFGSSILGYAYTYNAAGQRTRMEITSQGNNLMNRDGSYWKYSYDELGQVTGGRKYFADGTPVPGMRFGYTFDDIGNRKSMTDNGAKSAYTANLLNQYTERTVPGVVDVRGTAASAATVSLTLGEPTPDTVFDAERNAEYFYARGTVDNSEKPVRTDVTVTGVRNDANADGEDAVSEEKGSEFVPRTPEQFSYDADGNMTSDGRFTYTWNGENRLIKAESARRKIEFTYDYRGRRVQKQVYERDASSDTWSQTSDTRYVYNGWNLICERTTTYDPQSTTYNTYIWGLDLSGQRQGAGGVGGFLAVSTSNLEPRTSNLYYATYDGNGNVMALVDADDGSIAAQYEYDPFGRTLRQAGEMAKLNPFRFSTKYFDCETELYYYGYRYYSKELGRWLSRDPIGESGGINLSSFAKNSPITQFDALGRTTGNANTYTFGEIGSWAIKSPTDYSSPANLGDAKASIAAVCGGTNRCSARDGSDTTGADKAAWDNIVAASGTDQSGGRDYMWVGPILGPLKPEGNCYITHCWEHICGPERCSRQLVERDQMLTDKVAMRVGSDPTHVLWFFNDPWDFWCSEEDYNRGSSQCND